MGQQLKPSVEFPKLEWTQIRKDSNNTCIYRSSSGLLAEKRQLTQDKMILAEQQLRIYHQRLSTAMPLVNIYSALVHEEKKNFCSTSQKITLYLQYIPNRLQKIKSFSLAEPQLCYLLQQILKAFYQLFLKFGYFQIKTDLIGFNAQGHVKCWLNKDFANNRIENSHDSILNGNQYNQGNIDSRLRQTIQKAMVSDLWKIIKKKSNIVNKDLFYRLSGLQNTTFQNAKKLIQLLIGKCQYKLPDCLIFENCLSFKTQINRQYNYGKVYDSSSSRLKVVEIMENQVLRSGTFNFQPQQNDINFKDFEHYRDHIESLYKKTQNNCKVSISFEKNLIFKQVSNARSPQRVVTQINSPRKMLKIVDKTFDINICSNLRSPSIKTIPQTEPSQKKIQSDENIFLPLSTIQRQPSIVISNAVSERYILAEIQSNLPSSRVNISSKQIRSPVKEKIILPYESREPIFIQNYQPTMKRTSSRFLPPSQIQNFVIRQTYVGNSNQCKSPKILKAVVN